MKDGTVFKIVDTLRLQMMYKIIHHIVDLKLPNYVSYNRGIIRGHDFKLTVPFTRIDAYKFSFFQLPLHHGTNYLMK